MCQLPKFLNSRTAVVTFGIYKASPALAHPYQLPTLPEPTVTVAVRADIQNQKQDRINSPSVFPVAQAYVRNAFI